MRQYTVMYHPKQVYLKLTEREYCIVDMIHNLAVRNTHNGKWCAWSVSRIAKELNLNRVTCSRYINGDTRTGKAGLIERGLLERRGNFIRATRIWADTPNDVGLNQMDFYPQTTESDPDPDPEPVVDPVVEPVTNDYINCGKRLQTTSEAQNKPVTNDYVREAKTVTNDYVNCSQRLHIHVEQEENNNNKKRAEICESGKAVSLFSGEEYQSDKPPERPEAVTEKKSPRKNSKKEKPVAVVPEGFHDCKVIYEEWFNEHGPCTFSQFLNEDESAKEGRKPEKNPAAKHIKALKEVCQKARYYGEKIAKENPDNEFWREPCRYVPYIFDHILQFVITSKNSFLKSSALKPLRFNSEFSTIITHFENEHKPPSNTTSGNRARTRTEIQQLNETNLSGILNSPEQRRYYFDNCKEIQDMRRRFRAYAEHQ